MKKLVAYITTGFPDKNFTKDVAFALKEAGADILELGIPFSDPVADGPIIEEANLKSLQNGFKTEDLFEISKEIAPKIDTLWMGYFNSFYQKGIETISEIAENSGVSGFIIPDLPHEEAMIHKPLIKKHKLSLISFVAPTDSKRRIKEVVKDSEKFVYLVAYAGITGSGTDEDLTRVISDIKEYTDTDIYVGFGVNEKTARDKAKGVDGVIVGSSFVKVLLDDSLSNSQKIEEIARIAKTIKESIN